MTSQVKLPYYPKITAQCNETTFGAIEISCPNVYETPITGLRIVRVDLLECLREDFGDNCFVYRDVLYKLISGSTSKNEHLELFQSYYRRYAGITAFVNEIYYYGESEIPIVPRVLQRVRDMINNYREEVMLQLQESGGKFLVHTHDYLYFAYKGNTVIPNVKGVTIIC